MKLIIAEKPALAAAINEAISPNSIKQEGFFENGEYYVTWCVGHLLELMIPSDSDKSWSFEKLPVNYQGWNFQVKDNVKTQYNVIKKLLDESDTIINAGDPDEEGQLIVDSILYREGIIDLKGNSRKNIKRLLVNDFNIEAIKKELNNLKDNNDYLNLSYQALARALADKIFGYNMTRAYTVKNQQAGNDNIISIGRVQTPMLGLIYRREEEVKNHVKKNYFEINAKANVDDKNILDFKYVIKESEYEDDKKIVNIDTANTILTRLKNSNFKILEFSKKEEIENVPLPFNLLDLQQISSKKYGYKPDDVMNITQTLREEHKAITYNRSDCNYLLDESYQEAPELIETLAKLNNTYIINLISNCDVSIKSKCFDSSKTSAHTAIVPTNTTIDLTKMNEKQKNVYLLIVERYLMQFLPPAKYDKYTIVLINENKDELKYTHRVCKELGFKGILKNEEKEIEEKSIVLNENIDIDKEIKDISFEVETLETKPKKLYTMDTFLAELKSVAKYIKDPRIREILKEKDKHKAGEAGGIGTPATRSTIITKLYNLNFIKDEKKNIVTTDLGKEFINMVSEKISYPDMTALWHESMKEIGTEMIELDKFIKSVNDFSVKEIDYVKSDEVNFKSNAIKCPDCEKGYLRKRKGDYGIFWSCSNYPECISKYKDNKGKPDIYEKVECPICKKTHLSKMNGKNGIYWKCKECETTFKDNKGKPDLAIKEKPTPSEKYRCLECNSKLVLRSGKNGTFWGCYNYPKCNKTYKDQNGEPVYNNKKENKS